MIKILNVTIHCRSYCSAIVYLPSLPQIHPTMLHYQLLTGRIFFWYFLNDSMDTQHFCDIDTPEITFRFDSFLLLL